MQVRTASLTGEARPQRGFCFPSVDRAFSARGARNGCSPNSDNSETSRGRSPDSLPCPALG